MTAAFGSQRARRIAARNSCGCNAICRMASVYSPDEAVQKATFQCLRPKLRSKVQRTCADIRNQPHYRCLIGALADEAANIGTAKGRLEAGWYL